jgi:hypothetical protein
MSKFRWDLFVLKENRECWSGPCVVEGVDELGINIRLEFLCHLDAFTFLRNRGFGVVDHIHDGEYGPRVGSVWWPIRNIPELRLAHEYCMNKYARPDRRVPDWEVMLTVITYCRDRFDDWRGLFLSNPNLFWYYLSPYVILSLQKGKRTALELKKHQLTGG